MSGVGFIFPGQGSQVVGMGRGLAETFPEAKGVFEEADDAIGFSLSRVCFEGPEEELRKTEVTQPAILAVSVAAYCALAARTEARPAAAAGHSLGEYSALVAAESIQLSDAVRLVHQRGRLMQDAVAEGKGAMVAVVGATREQVEEACREAAVRGVVQAANFNSPGQVVISGAREAVEEAAGALRKAGAKRLIELRVSAPFHCALMSGAAEGLRDELAKTHFSRPTFPVVSNVTAEPHGEPSTIAMRLAEQVTRPVLWEDTIRWMCGAGIDRYFEIGPGRVLTGFLRRIEQSLRGSGTAVGEAGEVEAAAKALSGPFPLNGPSHLSGSSQ